MSPQGEPRLDPQLGAYTVGTRVYGQIFQLQKSLSETSYKFVALTGVIWGGVFNDKLAIPPRAVLAILALHAIASGCLLLYVVSLRNAMVHRFYFLPLFGQKYYPDIEAIGKDAFVKTFGGARTPMAKSTRWGRQMWVWYLVPAAGCAGSLSLIAGQLSK
jgi:hypothetical protein